MYWSLALPYALSDSHGSWNCFLEVPGGLEWMFSSPNYFYVSSTSGSKELPQNKLSNSVVE